MLSVSFLHSAALSRPFAASAEPAAILALQVPGLIWRPPAVSMAPELAIALAAAFGGVLAGVLLWRVRERDRRSRRTRRITLSGMVDGPRFRLVEVVVHLLRVDDEIDPERLDSARILLADISEQGLGMARLRALAQLADYPVTPRTFAWMRDGMTLAERRVILSTARALIEADGTPTPSDLRFLDCIARGLDLPKAEGPSGPAG